MSASAVPRLPAAPRRGLDRVRATLLPRGVLALMAAAFTFSSFVIGPALTDGRGGSTTPTTKSVPSAPPGVSPSEHEAHHR